MSMLCDESQRIVEKCGFTKRKTLMILNAGETEEKLFSYYRLDRNRMTKDDVWPYP